MTIEIKILNDHIKLPPSKKLDQSKFMVRRVVDGVEEILTPKQWGYTRFDPEIIGVEQEINITCFDECNKSHSCLAHVTVEKEPDARKVPKKAEIPHGRVTVSPSTATHTTVMVNVMDNNGGIYCAGGHDALPVGANIKTDANWSVYLVESQGATPQKLDDSLWTPIGFDTSVTGLTTGRIFADVGDGYSCLRSVTITDIPLNQIAITTPSLPYAIVNTPYSVELKASGSTTYTWSAFGLPSWLYLDAQSGILSGLPSESSVGVIPITVRVTGDLGTFATKNFDLVVSAPQGEAPHIATTVLKSGTVGTYYEQRVRVSGDQPMTWTAEGLPSGLDINDDEGTIFGTPTTPFSGTIAVTAANEYGDDMKAIALSIVKSGEKPVILTTSLPPGTVGKSYKYEMDVSGTEPIMWTCEGLPSGLRMSNITGDIYGRPRDVGEHSVSVTAVNNYGQSKATFNLKINNN